jgi:hypothetical protein
MGNVVDLRLERVLRCGWVDNHNRTWVLAGQLNHQDLERMDRDLEGFRADFGEHCCKSKEADGRYYLWRLKYAEEQPRFKVTGETA